MPYKLLLADDSVTIQRVIELTFADEDVKVTAVGDGQAAIDRIQAEPPDIVLADVGMPGRDGYEVASFVKEHDGLAHIPVLLLTGAFEPVDESRAEAVRCNGVLAKPFEPQLLIARVKELLAVNADRRVDEAKATLAAEETPAPPAADDDDTAPRGVPIAAAAPGGGFTADDFSLDTASIGEPAATPAADISLDDYFDRLDAAFATLTGAAAGQLKDAATGDADTSWAPPATGGWSPAEGYPVPEATGGGEAALHAHAKAHSNAMPHAAGAVSVADAFAALLEAEQQGIAAPAPEGEVRMPAASSAEPVVTDALVDRVAARLAERLGAEGLREIVALLVSETAEKLVREEIERLKAAAQG